MEIRAEQPAGAETQTVQVEETETSLALALPALGILLVATRAVEVAESWLEPWA